MSLVAVPASVSGLKNGGVSITLHVASQQAEDAFRVHKLQGKSVTIDLYDLGDD